MADRGLRSWRERKPDLERLCSCGTSGLRAIQPPHWRSRALLSGCRAASARCDDDVRLLLRDSRARNGVVAVHSGRPDRIQRRPQKVI